MIEVLSQAIVAAGQTLDSFELDAPKAWPEIKRALNTPPFTDPTLPTIVRNGRGNTKRKIPVVGNLVRQNSQLYEKSLVYREGGGDGDAEAESIPRLR